jgi:hypothetical protein
MKFAFSFLLLAACGGDYCDRSAKYAEDCDVPLADSDVDACEQALSSCDSDDQKALDDMLDCFEDNGLFQCSDTASGTAPTDTSGTTEDFTAAFACLTPALSLSAECAQSLGYDFGFTDATFTSTPTPTP